MDRFRRLLEANKRWVEGKLAEREDFFEQLSQGQSPEFLWIGCSDSRVPAEDLTGCQPGELFVHRNIGNLVPESDVNALSVLQYAVEDLKVKHVIVCGHYGCGGVLAALRNDKVGLCDNWLRHVQDVRWKHQAELDILATEEERHRRLCELNVIEQVVNVGQTTVVQDAWARGQALAVHGWVYDLHDGLLRDLSTGVTSDAELRACSDAIRASITMTSRKR
jgi:carbonic anhydrase